MNRHLQERIELLVSAYDKVTLATCGEAGVQMSIVNYRSQNLRLHLFIPRRSDHLFNLETEKMLVMLSPTWKLYGEGTISQIVIPPESWQVTVTVTPARLHILNEDTQAISETIDF